MTKLTPIQQIDEVLFVFQEKWDASLHRVAVAEKLKAKGVEINYEQLTELLVKLVKDEYLRVEKHRVKDIQEQIIAEYYIITYEGWGFDGYVRKEANERCEAKYENAKNLALTIGSILAGAGAIGLLAVEIYKQFFHCHCQ